MHRTSRKEQQESDCWCVWSYAMKTEGGLMSYNLQPSMDAGAAASQKAVNFAQRQSESEREREKS